jgi:hypothetical protein
MSATAQTSPQRVRVKKFVTDPALVGASRKNSGFSRGNSLFSDTQMPSLKKDLISLDHQ